MESNKNQPKHQKEQEEQEEEEEETTGPSDLPRLTKGDRMEIAEQTVKSVQAGWYEDANKKRHNIGTDVAQCIRDTRLYVDDVPKNIIPQGQFKNPVQIEVKHCTTLQAAQLLAKEIQSMNSESKSTKETTPISNNNNNDNSKTEQTSTPQSQSQGARQMKSQLGVLNFASAKNPGGGFLTGANAQEESIARSSSLYSSIAQDKFLTSYYAFNRKDKLCLYSDRIIYSPNVTIFKDDAGTSLTEPYTSNIVTSPAPNAGIVRKRHQDANRLVKETMTERIRRILYIFRANGDDALVLGAFGCGVFRNDPLEVALIFKAEIERTFQYYFRRIIFAILDPQMAHIFQQVFAGTDLATLQAQFSMLQTSKVGNNKEKRGNGRDDKKDHREKRK